jgi:Leucine-rich repeat (LRR) protein
VLGASFTTLGKIEDLDIRKNFWECIQELPECAITLKNLDVSENPLNDLPFDFSGHNRVEQMSRMNFEYVLHTSSKSFHSLEHELPQFLAYCRSWHSIDNVGQSWMEDTCQSFCSNPLYE